jgi:hypothetical protein
LKVDETVLKGESPCQGIGVAFNFGFSCVLMDDVFAP